MYSRTAKSPESWFLNIILQQKEPELLGEMTDSTGGEGNYKMSLGHLAVPESKKALKEQKGGIRSKTCRANLEELLIAMPEQFQQQRQK